MRITEMLEELAQRFGKDRIAVHSEYHVQIINPGKKPHDIWRGKDGLKWKFAGQGRVEMGPPERLLNQLGRYDETKTDFARMTAATELCNFIGAVTRVAEQQKIARAVFVDAGFKDGRGRIGIVKIDGNEVSAIRRDVSVGSIDQAERMAIEEGLKQAIAADGTVLNVYSDSKGEVIRFNTPQVVWISRELNRHADNVANLRSK